MVNVRASKPHFYGVDRWYRYITSGYGIELRYLPIRYLHHEFAVIM
jgi:hypothetical protein